MELVAKVKHALHLGRPVEVPRGNGAVADAPGRVARDAVQVSPEARRLVKRAEAGGWRPEDDQGMIPQPYQAGEHSGIMERVLTPFVHLLDRHGDVTARMPAPQGRQGEWLLYGNHNHSTYWDGKVSLKDMIATEKAEGMDAMAITDHDTMRGASSPEFLAEDPRKGGLVMVKGEEWNAFREIGEPVLGHAGILGMDGWKNLPPGASLDQMLAEASSRNATIIVNHPFNKGNAWTQAKPDPRAHGIEVWNHLWYGFEPIMPNDKARDWWDRSLREGRHLTAVGGTDSHGNHYDELDHPVNLVFAKERTPEAVLQAVRDGHVTVLHDSHAPRVVLEADDNADGVFEAIQGDTLKAEQEHRTTVRAHVLGGKGQSVEFYDRRGLVKTATVTSDDAYLPLSVVSKPGQQDYVRAELKKHPGHRWSMTALTNPVYLA